MIMANTLKHISIVMRILTFIGVAVLFFLNEVQAQQDAQYTQYMYNTVSVNPAYSGSRGHVSIAQVAMGRP